MPKTRRRSAASNSAPAAAAAVAADDAPPTTKASASSTAAPTTTTLVDRILAAKPGLLASMAIAALAGVIWFLSCADFDIWPFAWFAMVPALYVTERAPRTRRAFFLGWITGVVGNGGGFYWIVGLLTRFGHMPALLGASIFFLLAAYQGLVFGTFAALTRVIRRHTGLPMALVAPLVIVACELVFPMIFPFSVAITQAWQPHVIQVADLTGTAGVAALLLAVNGAIYDLACESPRRWKPALAGFGALVAALAYGHLRIVHFTHLRAAARSLDVGIVQPNVSFDMKGRNRSRYAEGQLEDLQEQTQQLEHEGAQFVVWPETAYPYAIRRDQTGDFRERDMRRIRAGFTVPVLFGSVTGEWGEHGPELYNTALMLDRDGRFTGRFDKMFLMLFGEYTPGRDRFPIIAQIMPSTTGQFNKGTTVTTLPLQISTGASIAVGPMICYEDIVSSFARQLAPEHPNLLVNITNDAWFGDTSEPWEHLALSVFRAVEMRTDLVRAVNTGVSAFVDATGHVYAKTYAVNPAVDPRGADHLHAHVALLDGGHTVYAVVGDLFAYLCTLATAFLWLAWPRIRRRRGTAAAST